MRGVRDGLDLQLATDEFDGRVELEGDALAGRRSGAPVP
jgi:hypothetical protein